MHTANKMHGNTAQRSMHSLTVYKKQFSEDWKQCFLGGKCLSSDLITYEGYLLSHGNIF